MKNPRFLSLLIALVTVAGFLAGHGHGGGRIGW
jgi:hypothetical protein